MPARNLNRLHFVFGCLMLLAQLGCSKDAEVPAANYCSTLSGTPWVPAVTGVSTSNRDSAVSISEEVLTAFGPITGLGQAATAERELVVFIRMDQDLGEFGSLTLVAQTTGFSSELKGGAYPLLVSLNDDDSAGNEFINLTSDCASTGFFTCSGDRCSVNSSCKPQWPSAYTSRAVWDSHQIPDFGYVSVNTFPTCNHSDGTQSIPSSSPACAFNTTFFSGGKLKSGKTYKAKFILVASQYKTVSGYSAGITVRAIKKTDTTSAVGGAIDLNVVLVGNKNIEASRTEKGKLNLDLLFAGVRSIYEQSNSNIKLGAINAVEWDCAGGGDEFASTLDTELGSMFKDGSARVAASTEGRAVNLFLLSEIPYESDGSNLTIAGSSSMILGPPLNGLDTSGVAVATFEKLATFNPACGSDACPAASQERDFEDMKRTLAHEMGHYLGLFHPSESGGTTHDPIHDTPICTTTQSVSGTNYITIGSCLNSDTNTLASTGLTCSQACPAYSSVSGTFCPTADECQFNHVMWWTSQNYKNGTGDGTTFSTGSGKILNYNPLVR